MLPALVLALGAGCTEDDGGDTGDKPATDGGGTNGDASVSFDAGGGGRDGSIDAARPDAQVTPSDAATLADASPVPVLDAGHDGGVSVVLPPAVSFVYIAGYDSPLHTYALDRSTGTLTEKGTALAVGDNPSYITPDATGKYLYVANESYSGNPGLSVLSVDSAGLPSKLDRTVTEDGPVFSTVDPSGKYLLMASYDGGFASVYAIGNDGKLGAQTDKKSFAKPATADSAQTHSVRVTPNGKFVYVPNKALNSIAQYAFDATTGKLAALTPASVATAGGPRHIAVDHKGAFAYAITEISGQAVAYKIGTDGALTEIDRKDAFASDFTGADKKGAHVLVSPDDKFVYTSTRGDSNLEVFAIGTDGKLTFVQRISSGGNTPRDFDLDSTGKFLIVANQEDGKNGAVGTVLVFAVGTDGKLTKTGTAVTGLQSPCAVSIVTHY